jgi:hypothetical protein
MLYLPTLQLELARYQAPESILPVQTALLYLAAPPAHITLDASGDNGIYEYIDGIQLRAARK